MARRPRFNVGAATAVLLATIVLPVAFLFGYVAKICQGVAWGFYGVVLTLIGLLRAGGETLAVALLAAIAVFIVGGFLWRGVVTRAPVVVAALLIEAAIVASAAYVVNWPMLDACQPP